jgi:hypothetical protein
MSTLPEILFDALRNAYDSEPDWNDAQRLIPLGYEQAQGKRIFYQQCVWCHADSTPAGPSNRSNETPTPPLFNDGSVLNGESDEFLENIIKHHHPGWQRHGKVGYDAAVRQNAHAGGHPFADRLRAGDCRAALPAVRTAWCQILGKITV